MKLTSQNFIKKEYANQSVLFPIIGTAVFDKDGNIEVQDELVDAFITATNDVFAFVPLSKSDNKKVTAELAVVEQEDTELRLLLDQSGIKELAEMAHEVGVETQDIANMTDAKLRLFLYKKIKEIEKSQPKLTTPNILETAPKKTRKKRGPNKSKLKASLPTE